jgi:hypothetical protein
MIIKYFHTHNKKDYWEIKENIIFTIWFEKIEVPKWFITDFWSLPKIAWWLLWHPLKYPYLNFYLLHDYFYSCKYKWIINRKGADYILFWQIKKFSILKAVIILIAIRLFWWLFYKKPLQFNKKDYE